MFNVWQQGNRGIINNFNSELTFGAKEAKIWSLAKTQEAVPVVDAFTLGAAWGCRALITPLTTSCNVARCSAVRGQPGWCQPCRSYEYVPHAANKSLPSGPLLAKADPFNRAVQEERRRRAAAGAVRVWQHDRYKVTASDIYDDTIPVGVIEGRMRRSHKHRLICIGRAVVFE